MDKMTVLQDIKKPAIGIDPDLHRITMVNAQAHSVIMQTIAVPRKLKNLETIRYVVEAFRDLNKEIDKPADPAPIYIEGQCVQYTGKTNNARKQDLIHLANMAGCIAGCASILFGSEPVFVLPVTWKGSIPKKVHQGRICHRMGWEFEKRTDYVVPIIPDDFPIYSFIYEKGKNTQRMINKGDWKHALDSLGLSLYGANR